jgi:hypothetical protein
MNDFSGGNQVDDVTMLVIRATPQENGRAGQRDGRKSPPARRP